MAIEHALIKSAGFGTRMQKVGESVPKVLWPIFEVTLLDLQITLLKQLGIKKIYINTHFLASQIHDHIREMDQVEFIHEEEIKNSGGAVTHLLHQKKELSNKKLLIVNGDSFLLFTRGELEIAEKSLKNAQALLLGVACDKNESFSKLIVEDDKLIDIRKNDATEDYTMFSGVSLVNTSKIKADTVPSSFFDTVADYHKNEVLVHKFGQNKFFDFGTLDSFCYQTKELILFALHTSNLNSLYSEFFDMLKDCGVLSSSNFDFSKGKYKSNNNKFMINFCKNSKEDKIQYEEESKTFILNLGLGGLFIS
ncbi:NTP transferase domain-containing protein [Candidatus Peregrinibacteria bacterium]|jgi:NDP-sugar pyrophosphorylase family protein|nr:NTP transferase domain-containing protein [Candidatus Peregrinibacteria bacterium]